jgi:hypothetical protein
LACAHAVPSRSGSSLAETVGVRAAGRASQGGSEGTAPPGSSLQQQQMATWVDPCACVVLQELTLSQAELLERIQKLKQVCMDCPTKCRSGLVQLIS